MMVTGGWTDLMIVSLLFNQLVFQTHTKSQIAFVGITTTLILINIHAVLIFKVAFNCFWFCSCALEVSVLLCDFFGLDVLAPLCKTGFA